MLFCPPFPSLTRHLLQVRFIYLTFMYPLLLACALGLVLGVGCTPLWSSVGGWETPACLLHPWVSLPLEPS